MRGTELIKINKSCYCFILILLKNSYLYYNEIGRLNFPYLLCYFQYSQSFPINNNNILTVSSIARNFFKRKLEKERPFYQITPKE